MPSISRGRQRDQSREPMKQIARLLHHIRNIAGPDRNRQQHHVHCCKAGNGETFQQPFGLVVVFSRYALGSEWVGAVTDLFDRSHDPFGIGFTIAPFDRETALRKIEPRVDDARQFLQTILDLANTARAADALDSQRYMRAAGLTSLDKFGKVESFDHPHSPEYNAVFGAEQSLTLLRNLDHKIPLTRDELGFTVVSSRRILFERNAVIQSAIDRT